MIVDALVQAEAIRQPITRRKIDSGAGLGFRPGMDSRKICAHGPSSDKSWVDVQRRRLNCVATPLEIRKNMQWVTRAACGAYVFTLALQVSAADLTQIERYRLDHEAAIVAQLDELTRLKSVAADPQGLLAMAGALEQALKNVASRSRCCPPRRAFPRRCLPLAKFPMPNAPWCSMPTMTVSR